MKTECESCQFPDIECKTYRVYGRGTEEDQKKNYCEVCASSLISNLVHYGHPDSPVLQTIGYCTNLILKAVRDKA